MVARLDEEPVFQSTCEKIQISLSQATRNQVGDEEEDGSVMTQKSQPKICLECGHAKYQSSKRVWNLRHRAITQASTDILGSSLGSPVGRSSIDSLASLGKSSRGRAKSLQYRRHAQWVATIKKKISPNGKPKIDEDGVPDPPPLELVQLVLRVSEFISMLKQANVELSTNSNGRSQCWSRADQQPIDLEPVLDYIREKHLPDEPRNLALVNLLSQSMKISSFILDRIATKWDENWEVKHDNTLKSIEVETCPEPAFRALSSFVHACLIDAELSLPLTEIEYSALKGSSSLVSNLFRNGDTHHSRVEKDVSDLNGLGDRVTADSLTFYVEENSKERSADTTRTNNKRRKFTNGSDKMIVSSKDGTPTRENSNKRSRTNKSLGNDESTKKRLRHLGSNGKTRAVIVDSDSTYDGNKEQNTNRKLSIDSNGEITLLDTVDDNKRRTEEATEGEQPINNARLTEAEIVDISNSVSESEIDNQDDLAHTFSVAVLQDSSTSADLIEGKQASEAGSTVKAETEKSAKAEFNSGKNRVHSAEPIFSTIVTVEEKEKTESSDVPNSIDKGLVTFKDLPHSEWMQLSHIGHLSDYHGFQRNYASFIPLTFKRSLSEVQEHVEETLNDVKSAVEEESDEEVAAEMEEYAAAIQGYQKKIDSEQKQRVKISKRFTRERYQQRQDNKEYQRIESLPIRFLTGSEMMSTEETHQPSIGGKDSTDLSVSGLPVECPRFKQIETDNIDFWQDCKEQGKRRSRREELVEQRNISIMMLSEIGNTLKFIEKYNKGILEESTDVPLDESCSEDNKTSHCLDNVTANTLETLDSKSKEESPAPQEKIQKGKRKAKGSEKKSKLTAMSTPANTDVSLLVDDHQPKVVFRPSLARLEYSHLLSDYYGLRRRFQSSFPIPKDSTIGSLKDTIMSIVEKHKEDVTQDAEIRREEKAQIRIRKGYNQKADQEKIEKRKHEDDRMLELREYEYLTRTRKASPEELELEKLEERPLTFHQKAKAIKPKTKDSCKIGPNCSLCLPASASMLAPEGATSQATIHNPSFRRVDPDYIYEMDDEEQPKGRRANRITENTSQRKLTVLKLQEMYHTLEFIEKYNTGMIN